jgi:SAM-dependent methyltransferase
MLKDNQDAFGHALRDSYVGGDGFELVERDDGFFDVSAAAETYLSEWEDWPKHVQDALELARGTVLDVGCGGGRHALHLQGRGFAVTGIDHSPLAVEVCRLRGLRKSCVLSVTQISSQLGSFDTILMLGNNFGLGGSEEGTKQLLRELRRISSDRGRTIAETRDPYQTDILEHLDYHERNRQMGRMAGQARIRIRYKKYVTPWFELLLVSKEEMMAVVGDTGWEVGRFIDGSHGMYITVLEKVDQ